MQKRTPAEIDAIVNDVVDSEFAAFKNKVELQGPRKAVQEMRDESSGDSARAEEMPALSSEDASEAGRGDLGGSGRPTTHPNAQPPVGMELGREGSVLDRSVDALPDPENVSVAENMNRVQKAAGGDVCTIALPMLERMRKDLTSTVNLLVVRIAEIDEAIFRSVSRKDDRRVPTSPAEEPPCQLEVPASLDSDGVREPEGR